MGKKGTLRFVGSLVAAVLLIASSEIGYGAPSGQSINYVTTPVGQGNYTTAVSQGQLISRKTNIQVVVQPANGPKAIPGLLETSDGQLGILSSMGTSWAYTGTGDYDKAYKFIRILQSGNTDYFSLITRDDTRIKTFADLKGKRVTYSVTSLLSKYIMEYGLQAYGLTPAKDVTLLKAEEAGIALRDLAQGRTDTVSCALGGAKMAELATKTKIVILPIDGDKIPFLQKRLQAMFSVTTPNNLSGVDPGVPVIATATLIIGRADLSDDLAYEVVKTLIENYNELKTINPVMADWKPEVAVREWPVPYHPGAIKYYKEKGLWNPKMDQVQQKLQGK